MQAAERTPLKLIYEGSVKRVFEPESATPTKLWFEFTDDYSVFDWGKMPDTIAQKGRALTVMGAWFFETLAPAAFWQSLKQSARLKSWLAAPAVEELFRSDTYRYLCESGLPSHFQRLVDENGNNIALKDAACASQSVRMEVLKANVYRPEPFVALGQTLYSYPPVIDADKNSAGCRLIPLEVVFRFGMPAGSSLKERLAKDPDYLHSLGLSKPPKEGELFDRPVLEFFTKLEPKDRLLSLGEALAISTLNASQFKRLTDLAQLCAFGLFEIFGKAGVDLWDGKFEFILDGDTIRLADSIGPDELRLLYKGLHLSKEIIRQVYRGSKWEKGLKEAQLLAKQRQSHDWKSICRDEFKLFPDRLPVSFKSAIDLMYPTLVNQLAGEQLFQGMPGLDGIESLLNNPK